MAVRNDLSALPGTWRRALGRFAIEPVERGMSEAELFRLRDRAGRERYLKICRGAARSELRNEVERTQWLAARGVRVPRFLRVHEDSVLAAALMTALPGRHPPDAGKPPAELVRHLARGLFKLHSIPALDCPFDEAIKTRLTRARDMIARGLIDPADFAERNRGLAPRAIYDRLIDSVPEREDIVIVHGDATFDNLLIDAAGNIGFIDCGHAGRGDRYLDLSAIIADIDEHFGQDCMSAFARSYGQAALDMGKLGFFSDLYELF